MRFRKCKVNSLVRDLSIPLGSVIFGVFMLPVLYVSQIAAAIPTDRDSLCRYISPDHHAILNCSFIYARNNADVISGLGDNALELARLDTFIRQAVHQPEVYVGHIRLTGYSSIDGCYLYNDALARKRAEQFYVYLRRRYPELRHYPHNLAWVAEDWSSLTQLVKDSRLGQRGEILDIIRKVRAYDERETLLVKLDGGHAYDVIKRTMLPLLRRVELQVEYKQAINQSVTASINSTIPTSYEPTASLRPSPKGRKYDAAGSSPLSFGEGRGEAVEVAFLRPLFALKSNLSQWAGVKPDFSHTTFVPNLALEYLITPHWSVEIGAMYSYWHYNQNREFQGVSGYRLEPRYRWLLVRDRLELFLGIYGRIGDYDVTSNPVSWSEVASVTGDYWDLGLSVGFTVGLFGGWMVEAGTRVGYLRTDAIRYTPDGKYNWFVSEHPYNRMQITDLNISLIYRFKGIRYKIIK